MPFREAGRVEAVKDTIEDEEKDENSAVVKLAVVEGDVVSSCEPEMEEETVKVFMTVGVLRLDVIKRVALAVTDTVAMPEWVIGDKDGDWEAWVEREAAREEERVADTAVEVDQKGEKERRGGLVALAVAVVVAVAVAEAVALAVAVAVAVAEAVAVAVALAVAVAVAVALAVAVAVAVAVALAVAVAVAVAVALAVGVAVIPLSAILYEREAAQVVDIVGDTRAEAEIPVDSEINPEAVALVMALAKDKEVCEPMGEEDTQLEGEGEGVKRDVAVSEVLQLDEPTEVAEAIAKGEVEPVLEGGMVGEARREGVGIIVGEGGPALTETPYVALPVPVGKRDVAAGVSVKEAMTEGELLVEIDIKGVALPMALREASEDGELVDSTRDTVASEVTPEDRDCV